ncbi:hypothetical protein ABVK25_007372 [Lepraria finkii]|uniref:GDP/GTP exchange factor Sec2 N-terminal domain-containing protein n=1 Tax=Lepraria finkii TaxID=1340010 RepID=A0ABR4B4H7_9LECA
MSPVTSSSTSSTTTTLQPPIRPAAERFITAPTVPVTQNQICHSCGADLSHSDLASALEDARKRITELETQVRILTGKATAAVDKLADYEDQLHQLKTSHSNSKPPLLPNPSPNPTPHVPLPSLHLHYPPQPVQNPSQPASPTSYPTPRRPFSHSQPDLTHPTSPPPNTITDPSALLAQERTLRLAAKSRAASLSSEIEDLSAQLFSEANEMVCRREKSEG